MKTTTYESNGRVTVSDKPVPTALEMTRASLTIAVRAFNRIHRYSWPTPLSTVDNTVAEMKSTGCSLPEAINNNFAGDILHYLMNRIKRG